MLRDSLMNFLGMKDSDTVVLSSFGVLPKTEPLILNRMSNDFEFFQVTPWADGLLFSLALD